MKKITIIMFSLLAIVLWGCGPVEVEVGGLKGFELPKVINEDIQFPASFKDSNDVEYALTYSSNNSEVLDKSGIVGVVEEDTLVLISVTTKVEKIKYQKDFEIMVLNSSTNVSTLINAQLDEIIIPNETTENLVFSKKTIQIAGISFDIEYSSSDKSIINNKGVVNRTYDNQDVNITAKVVFNSIVEEKTFHVTVLKKEYTEREKFLIALEGIVIPSIISADDDFSLITSFPNGVTGEWVSSKPDVFDENGEFVFRTYEQKINLQLILSIDGVESEGEVGWTITLPAIENSLEFLAAIELINIPSEATEKISLPHVVEIDGNDIELEYLISNPELINYDGTIHRNEATIVYIQIRRFIDNRIEFIELGVFVPAKEEEVIAESFDLGITETYDDIELPLNYMGLEIIWDSSNEKVISSMGKYSFVSEDTDVELSALFLDEFYTEIIFTITAKPVPHNIRLDRVIGGIIIPEVVESTLNLKTSFEYDVTAEWSSNKEDVITSSGIVYLSDLEKEVKLTVTLTSGESTLTKEFIVTTIAIEGTQVMGHNYQDYAKDFNLSNMIDVHVEDQRLVLNDGKTSGTYVSSEFNTLDFNILVASWAAISSTKGTAEIEVKVKVDGVWSKYFSYQKWGLGLQNKSVNSSDLIAKLSTDEVSILNSKTANAYQYKVTLRRNASSDESPKLLLVAVALTIPGYTYVVDATGFPDFVDYDVPMLNQNEVPTIGGSICSITSSTMLLKYKGHSFTEFDAEYEHRYIAGLFKDYGSGIYGNWVYNTVGMSAYGEETYVNKMYSFEELQKHLVEVGPISASVKGNMGLYTTNGHLIVVRGYRIVNGQTFVITNDPNINSRFGAGLFVYYEYPLATFMNVWRGVNYIIK